MEQIAVHAVRFRSGGSHRNAVLVGIFDHLGTCMELPVRIAPCGNDLDIGFHCISGKLETDLVVSFSGRAVADCVRAFLACNFDQLLADQRARNGGSEQISAFVNRVRLHRRENEIFCELLADIINIALGSAGGDGFPVEAGQFFFLPDVRAIGNDFGVIGLFDPLHNDRRIKPAGVSDYNLHFSNLLPIF